MSISETQKTIQKRTKKGEERVREILSEARSIFSQEGHEQLTLNKLAERLNIHKYNIQYYFKTRDDLIRGLILDAVGGDYQNNIKQLADNESLSPEGVFTSVISYFIEDLHDPIHRGFFIQLFALATSDKFINQFVQEYYERIFDEMAPLVQKLNPKISKSECRTRVTLIVSVIDGLGVVIGENLEKREYKKLKDLALESILHIALR